MSAKPARNESETVTSSGRVEKLRTRIASWSARSWPSITRSQRTAISCWSTARPSGLGSDGLVSSNVARKPSAEVDASAMGS